MLFNVYTNDQPIFDRTKHFIYADGLASTAQGSIFKTVKNSFTKTLEELTRDIICYNLYIIIIKLYQPFETKSGKNSGLFFPPTKSKCEKEAYDPMKWYRPGTL